MNEQALREEICFVGRSLFERGYVHATAGNISVLLDDGSVLITPSDACLGRLTPGDLVRVDEQGNAPAGTRPSKTIVLHRRIYRAEPSARCVIHTHSTHLVALTLKGVWRESDIVPPITPYFVMKVGHVPLIPYRRPGDAQAGDLVAEAIAAGQRAGTPLRAVMLDRLGPNVWHDSPAAAMAVLEELEETARLWLMTGASALTEEQIRELRDAFGARW